MTTINNTSADAERKKAPGEMTLREAAEIVVRGWFDGDFSEVMTRYEELATPAVILNLLTPATADVAADIPTWHSRVQQYEGPNGYIEPEQEAMKAEIAALRARLAAGAPAETVKAVTDAQIKEIANQHDLYSIQDNGRVSGDTLLSFARDVLALTTGATKP